MTKAKDYQHESYVNRKTNDPEWHKSRKSKSLEYYKTNNKSINDKRRLRASDSRLKRYENASCAIVIGRRNGGAVIAFIAGDDWWLEYIPMGEKVTPTQSSDMSKRYIITSGKSQSGDCSCHYALMDGVISDATFR